MKSDFQNEVARLAEKERPVPRRRSNLVTFSDKTVYHEYKTRSRIRRQSDQDGKWGSERIAYGGKGQFPGERSWSVRFVDDLFVCLFVCFCCSICPCCSGVMTTVTETTGKDIECDDCYVVISSYSSLKHGDNLKL